MNGGLNLLLFLGVVGFSIYRSKQRLLTMLFAFMAIALTLGSVVAFAAVFRVRNANAVGAAAFDVSLLVGMLVAFIHSRPRKP